MYWNSVTPIFHIPNKGEGKENKKKQKSKEYKTPELFKETIVDEIKEIILENEKEYNELQNKQYSYENLFNKKQDTQTIQETKEPQKIEDISNNSDSNNLPVDTSSLPLYQKILLKIKNFFSKNK